MNNTDILYIEDNFHNRRIVRKILERQGYMLHECEDGLEGYEMLKAMKPGIVLLDISLPSMDGMEIAGRVKSDPELEHIYLIALTASAMQGDRERFLEGGCDDYLSKPFRALDLVELVGKYMTIVTGDAPAPAPQLVEKLEEQTLDTVEEQPAAEVEQTLETEAAPVVELEVEEEQVVEAEVTPAVELEAEEKLVAEAEAAPVVELELEEEVEVEAEAAPAVKLDVEEAQEVAAEEQAVVEPPETEIVDNVVEAWTEAEPEVSSEVVEPEKTDEIELAVGENQKVPAAANKKNGKKARQALIEEGILGSINAENIKPANPNG